MTDRDDVLRRVRRANPAPPGQDLPAEIADSRPPAAWLIEGKYTMADATQPEARQTRWRGPAIAAAGMVLALAIGLPLLFLRGGEEAPVVVTEVTTTLAASTTAQGAATTTTAPTTTAPTTISTSAPVAAPTVEGTWRVFSTADGLPAGGNPVVDAAPDGTVWAYFPGAGLARFDGERWTVFSANAVVPEERPDSGIGAEWIVAMPDGLVLVDIEGTLVSFDGTEWVTQSFPDGSPVQVTSSSEARLADDGTLWIAEIRPLDADHPYRGRVLSFDGAVWSEWEGPDLPEGGGPARWMMEVTPEGAVWFVVGGTAWRQDRDRIDRFDLPGAPVCCESWVTAGADGAVWVYAGYGVSRFDPSTSTWTHYGVEDGMFEGFTIEGGPLGNHPIWTGIPTSDGSLWMKYPAGVSRFDGERWTSYTISEARAAGIPITSDWIFAMYASGDDGSTWAIAPGQAGAQPQNLHRHDGVSWSVVDTPVGLLHWGRVGDGTAGQRMVVTPDGTACIATQDGQIACFQPE